MRGKKKNHYKKKKSGVKNSFKFLSVVLVILLIYVIAMGVWFGFYMKSKIDYNKKYMAENSGNTAEQQLDEAIKNAGEALDEANKTAEDRLAEANILGSIPDKTFFGIYGVDQDEALSDVIIVACFDKNTQTVNALSIPRDTYVTLSDDLYNEMKRDGHYGPKTMKINAVHSWGEEDGDKYLTEELEEMLGIPQISYYITVNVEAFQKIVDDIGGIYVDVPQNMHYSDATQDLFIDLTAGPQTLDGYQAMGLVRFRQYVNGDVDRVKVQQLFLRALLEQALTTENILKNINNYVETFLTYVKTNMTVKDALKYTPFFPVLSQDSLTLATLPGGLRAGDSGYFINPDYTDKLVDILFYDGDGTAADYSGLSWGGSTADSAEAVAQHEERELDDADNGEAIRATIDYQELARLNDKVQYFQKLTDIIADFPTPSDDSKNVIADYIEFASSSFCNRAFYRSENDSADNEAIINASSLTGLGDEVKSFCEDMLNQLRDAEIGLARDVQPIARLDISGFDYDKPIQLTITKDVLGELEGIGKLLILAGDNLHQISINVRDLEKIFENTDTLKISFLETSSGYNISFKDENDSPLKNVAAPVYFGFYTIYTSPSCYLSTNNSVENIGGVYDGNNKCLVFSAVESGDYMIQNVEEEYDALEDFGTNKRQRVTEFLSKGFVNTSELEDTDETMGRAEFMEILNRMLKADPKTVLSPLGIEEEGNLTYGELLASAGTIANVYKRCYYPNDTNYFLNLYNIYDNRDDYDKPVALSINYNFLGFKGDTLYCKEDATEGDVLNVLSNLYNEIFTTSPAEYFFNETEAPPIEEPIQALSNILDNDVLIMYIVLGIFGLVALLIIIALIAIFVKSRKLAKAAKVAEQQNGNFIEAKNNDEGYDDEYDDEYEEDYEDDRDYIYEDDEDYIYEYDEDEEYDEDLEYDEDDDDDEDDDYDDEYEEDYEDDEDDEDDYEDDDEYEYDDDDNK